MRHQKPTDVLKADHKTIKDIINILNTCAIMIKERKKIDPGILKEAVSLVNNFTHRYHRRKEESVLFKIMARKGSLTGLGLNNVATMINEHDEGAVYVRKLAALLKDSVNYKVFHKRTVLKNLHGYISLLSSHLMYEENVLYPVINKMLNRQEQQNVLKSFEAIEEEMANIGDADRYKNAIKNLERRLRD
ncbi:hemerythrin domain-containing protein [Patescibacteria group bacterium]|nr:hemerythrin domain-containing protein [Patescibacteria group bacterium]MBU4000375.1 hemerythrin domain-containing protein [Patescibacteria group bacterium]MBU4056458.1 hemerythrin domain-containing protein [Patescibacteria group bacterium]MBU4368834.1 hemerythrin domain-containing protein [Patescibacteria group bacterium]